MDNKHLFSPSYQQTSSSYAKTNAGLANSNFYANRFTPYGGLLTPKSSASSKASNNGTSLPELSPPLNHEQLAAASLALHGQFNPFNAEAFYQSIQNSYLSPALTPNRNMIPSNFNNQMAAKMALQTTLNQYPLASSLLAANNAFKTAFSQNQRSSIPSMASFLNSPVSSNQQNVSSASSGYSTSDETYPGSNDTNKDSSVNVTNESLKSVDNSDGNEVTKCDVKVEPKQPLSLAHIMNWIKSTPSAVEFNEVTSKVMYAALKWTKTQKNFCNLPHADQVQLINESLSELFVLQMAESKMGLNEFSVFLNESNEDNAEQKKLIQNFQSVLQKFNHYKVDLMEFFLLKSIVLFKADNLDIQEKAKVESIQEECFNTLFNYNKLNYPNSSRFGRLLILFTEVKNYTSKLVQDSLLKSVLGKNHDISQILQDIN